MFKKLICVGILLSSVVVQAASYRDTLLRHHRVGQTYSLESFAADIIWNAVYLSPEMRQSLWQHETTITEKSAELNSPLIMATQVHGTQFLVNMYAPKDCEEFNASSSSFWTATLVKDGVDYPVSQVDPIELNPLVRRMLPFINRWGKLYLVTFGSADLAPPFTFRMVSPIAKSALKWKHIKAR